MSRKQICPICAGSDLTIQSETQNYRTADGDEISYESQYTRCGTCGEEFVTREQGRATARAIAGIERQRAGFLTPAEILAFRKSYGLTQEQMEAVFGFGKKTWLRWENGLVCQSRAVDRLLREARDSPEKFRRMAAQAGVDLPVAEHEATAFLFNVTGQFRVAIATTEVPTHLRPGPSPSPGVEYTTIDWAEVLGNFSMATMGGARVNQTSGSASPELLFAIA